MVLVFPGGGYVNRAEHERVVVAEFFARAGFASAVLDYRVQHPARPAPLSRGPLWDAQRAVRLIRTHARAWGVDGGRIVVLGFSAGGHLAAMCGTHFDDGDAANADPVERTSSRPDGMVLCYPVTGRHKVVEERVPDAGEDFAFYECEKNVSGRTPRAFLWHTSDDPVVNVGHSLRMTEALAKHGVGVELHVFASGRHGLGLAEAHGDVAEWTWLCVRWLNAG